jgi:hypothetical protein
MVGGECGAFSSGTDNIFIGVRAGYHTSGNSNLEISNVGTSLIPSDPITSNKLNINEIIVGDTSTKNLAIGNINATHLSPNATLEIVPQNITDVALLASGNVSISGTTTIHGGLETFSNTPSGLITQTIVNTSGHMIVPGYATSGDVITAFPPSPPHSGVLAVGGGYLMWCNGTSWLSGIQLA